MRNWIPGAVLIGCALIAATPAGAQTTAERKAAERFAQVRAAIGGDGPSDRIVDAALRVFLAREVARRTLLPATVVTTDWAAVQARNLLQQADTNRDGAIEADEVPDLESAKIRLIANLRAATQAERDAAPTVDFKTLLPKPGAPAASTVPFAERLATWLQIRQSFLDEKLVEKPATLSYATFAASDATVDTGAKRTQWSVAAAMVVRPGSLVMTPGNWELYPVAAYEASLSSGLKKDLDSVTHRVGLAGSWLNGSASVAHAVTATFDYNTDRSYASTVLGATLQYTPGIAAAGIGRFRDLTPNVSATWRPSAGFTFGEVKDKGTRTDLADRVDFSDLYAKIGSKLVFATRAAIISEATVFRQLRGDAKTRGLAESSFNLYITPENSKTPVSLQLSGSIGRKSPAFKKQQAAKLALAFKF
jgi:hypothetical protein